MEESSLREGPLVMVDLVSYLRKQPWEVYQELQQEQFMESDG